MTDETAVLEPETAETDATVKGRPRPAFTLERDEAVYAALSGQHSREQLAADFGVNLNLIYLSLDRLRAAGRVEKVRSGKSHLWQRTAEAQAPTEG